MTSLQSTRHDMQREFENAVRVHWALFLIQGIVMVILGILAVVWPQISTIAADLYIGWTFLISGILGLVTMFWARGTPAFLWSMLTAALSLIVGVLLVWHPVTGVVSLTLALVALFVVEGIFQIATAIRYRDDFPGSWGWMAMSGVVDLLMAGLIIGGWPGTATWVLGLMVGVNLVSSGLAIIIAALAARQIVKAATGAGR